MAKFDPDPLKSFGYQVRATHRAFDRVLQLNLSQHRLNNGFWYVLRVLWEKEGLTQRELAREVNITESSMVSMLEAMKRVGLVRRTRDRHDKRRMRTYLTAKSRSLKRKLVPYAGEINELAAAGIAQRDLATLLRVLAKMKQNLEAAVRPTTEAAAPKRPTK